MPSSPPRVAVIVLSWNNFVDSKACIESIFANSYCNLWPILVDNGSTDASYELLKQAFPQVDTIRNEENLGFSRGCNVGIRKALVDRNCSYVMLLNNDCILEKSGVDIAVSEMEACPAIGIVTGKILFNDGTNRIWHAGGSINKLTASAKCRGLREVDSGQYGEIVDTQWASGAMMIVSRQALERAGLLPEEYFFGIEEWDYSLTMRDAGFRIRYVPQFVGYHHGDGSHNNHDPKFVYNYYRNKLIFQQKFHGSIFFFFWKFAFRFYVLTRLKARITQIKGQGIFTPEQNIHRVEDIVNAAFTALRDHGKNQLTERTMLDFERTQLRKPANQS